MPTPLSRYSTIPSGCSTVSYDENVIVVSNLYDGLDWYKIPDRAFSRSVPIRIAKNVIIPVQFAGGDNLLITGGTSGMAKVLDARTAETIQTLDHDCRYTWLPLQLNYLTSPTNTADDTIQAIVRHTNFRTACTKCTALNYPLGFPLPRKEGHEIRCNRYFGSQVGHPCLGL